MLDLPAWQALQTFYWDFENTRIEELLRTEPNRVDDFSTESSGIFLDFSKHRISRQGFKLLLELAQQAGLTERINQLFSGEKLNNTEDRPALHTALRNEGQGLDAATIEEFVQTRKRQEEFVDSIRQGHWKGYSGKAITDVVNIGIGGSDLGPVMATRALLPYVDRQPRVSFVSNIDGSHISEVLRELNPETTLFIVASKSFSTLETRKNAEAARSWCMSSGIPEENLKQHFIAVSTNVSAAGKFGIPVENIFPMWDFVGGRYSIWSAIGLPVALAIGNDNFELMLAGARSMDQHFFSTTFEKNMPVILALLSIWYINFFKTQAEVVIPYDHYLHKFPAFLQQLQMESNGKSVNRAGKPLDYLTAGVVFGESGSNTQHSFHQLLHQGTNFFPVDFIVPIHTHNPVSDQHEHLVSNCLAQSRALMTGKSREQIRQELTAQGLEPEVIDMLLPHKVIPGNRPSSVLLLDKLTPFTLGALIALYEHKVFVQSVIWDINAFDQWGVELGKQLGEEIFPLISGETNASLDPSTDNLVRRYQKGRTGESPKKIATG